MNQVKLCMYVCMYPRSLKTCVVSYKVRLHATGLEENLNQNSVSLISQSTYNSVLSSGSGVVGFRLNKSDFEQITKALCISEISLEIM